MFLVVNIVASTALRNQTNDMSEIIFTKPIKPTSYQLGRLLGSFAVVLTIFLAVPIGMLVGSLMPWVDTTRFGPIRMDIYISGYFIYVVPTLFFLSCFFYSLAIRFKSVTSVYLMAIVVIILNEITGEFLNSPQSRSLASLLDPFAVTTFFEISRYWSIAEKNTTAITITDTLLINRFLWISIGIFTLAVFGRLKQLDSLATKRLSRRQLKKNKQQNLQANQDRIKQLELATTANIDSKGSTNRMLLAFLTRMKFEFKAVIFNPGFILLGIITSIILLVSSTLPQGMFGTPFLPLTQTMVEMIRSSTAMMIMIVITYYTAEVVWRERQSGIGDIVDSMPINNFIFWLSKLTAVWAVVIALLLICSLVTMSVQYLKGYPHIDILQYFISLSLFSALPWMMYVVLAFLLQVVSSNKYIGMAWFVIFIGSRLLMDPLGLEHHMFQFGQAPELQFSDINGYGDHLKSQLWYLLYWGAISTLLGLLSYGLWHRGPQQSIKSRLSLFSYQIGQSGRYIMWCSLLTVAIAGAGIIYNTLYLNVFISSQQQISASANYEAEYSKFANSAAPQIQRMNVTIDIFPEQRKIEASAVFEVKNTSSLPIQRFLISMPVEHGYSVELTGGKLSKDYGPLTTHWFEFKDPLQPGEVRQGEMSVIKQRNGFSDINPDLTLVRNGTFINNTELFPVFGYQPMEEIRDSNDRARHNLGEANRANSREDESHYQKTIMGHMSGYIDFEATLSTSMNQIAIAPGYLQREWQQDGRRYFKYKMDSPIENYYSIMSAELKVETQMHNGVQYEVYYHPSHEMNVPIMMEAMKDSVDYYGRSFGPYQHRQARIIEFPGYRIFAQSFPNTIAYSEKIGFINDTRDENQINSVYYVTAHEMAHQWWGGQVHGANVQGSTVISETMSQYSALMLTRKKYGMEKVRRILKFELDRYLSERSRELIEEQPLARAENQQYIHYRKGSVVMMSLLDLLGEQRLNHALSEFIKQYKFSGHSYPTTIDLVRALAKGSSEDERTFIHQMFEEINLYNLIAKEGKLKRTENGEYEVTIIVDAKRLIADGQGIETETPLSQIIEIALFSENPYDSGSTKEPLYLEKHQFKSGENIIKIQVKDKPDFALVDPYIKLIDRDTDDNLISF